MIYKPTVLNSFSSVLIGLMIVHLISDFNEVSEKGWILPMIGLVLVGVIAGLIDLLIQRFIKNRIVVNFLGILAGGIITFIIFSLTIS